MTTTTAAAAREQAHMSSSTVNDSRATLPALSRRGIGSVSQPTAMQSWIPHQHTGGQSYDPGRRAAQVYDAPPAHQMLLYPVGSPSMEQYPGYPVMLVYPSGTGVQQSGGPLLYDSSLQQQQQHSVHTGPAWYANPYFQAMVLPVYPVMPDDDDDDEYELDYSEPTSPVLDGAPGPLHVHIEEHAPVQIPILPPTEPAKDQSPENQPRTCDWHPPREKCYCSTWLEYKGPKPQVETVEDSTSGAQGVTPEDQGVTSEDQEGASAAQEGNPELKGDRDSLIKRTKWLDAAIGKELGDLRPLSKVTYEEHPDIAKQTEEDVVAVRAGLNSLQTWQVKFEREKYLEIPKPVTSFLHCFKPYQHLLQYLVSRFEEPTPIQCQLWPCLMSGINTIGVSQMRTGKTLGYLLPALLHAELQRGVRSGLSPAVLIVCPTCEQAQDLGQEIAEINYPGVTSKCLSGDRLEEEQWDELQRDPPMGQEPDIVICTPRTLHYHVTTKLLYVKEVSLVVVDQVEQYNEIIVRKIHNLVKKIRPDHQTCIISSEWSRHERQLMFSTSAVLVLAGPMNLPEVTVDQHFKLVLTEGKFECVHKLLQSLPGEKIIIFVDEIHIACSLATSLWTRGFSCACIHGSLTKEHRQQVLVAMQSGRVRILVSTELVPALEQGVGVVVNYHVPRTMDRYARHAWYASCSTDGRRGRSYTLLNQRNLPAARKLISLLTRSGVPIPDELKTLDAYSAAMYQGQGH